MLSVNVHEFSKVKLIVLCQIPQVLEEGRNKNNLLNQLAKLHFQWAIFIFLVLQSLIQCFVNMLSLLFLHLQWEPSRKGGNFGHIISVLAATSECLDLQMSGVHSSTGISTLLGCAVSKADWPCQGVHSCCCSRLQPGKLILGSKSCPAATDSKQSTLLFKYFATLPERVPGMSREKVSRRKFIKVQEIILSAAEGQLKHLLGWNRIFWLQALI